MHHSYDILAKNLATFCTYPKNLPEVKLNGFGLMPLAEEISRYPNIDCDRWLWVATLIQIYNEKAEAKQGKMQDVWVEEK